MVRHVGILNDLTKCIGCEACVWACKEINELPRDEASIATLSAVTWTRVDRRGGVNIRRNCMHCLEPACVSVCPVAALHKTEEGAVVYDAKRCMGCRYCMVGCPFDMPKYEWDKPLPLVRKCIMCYEKRLSEGKQPACTSVCPTGATIFGERDALVEEAHRRIRNEPDKYVNHIYGLQEAGGTSVLYLSPVPFADLGFKETLRYDPYPRLTWQVLSKLPNVVSIAGLLLVGVWWVIGRRQELARLDSTEVDAPTRGEERRGEHTSSQD